jgi:hypothetical protein
VEEFGPFQIAIQDERLGIVGGVESKDGNKEKEQELKCRGNSVGDEIGNALKDFASNDNSVNDGTKTFFREDNVGSSAGSISCTGDGNSNIGALEGRGICIEKSKEKGRYEITTLDDIFRFGTTTKTYHSHHLQSWQQCSPSHGDIQRLGTCVRGIPEQIHRR